MPTAEKMTSSPTSSTAKKSVLSSSALKGSSGFLQYLTNVKSMAGLLAILFALYMMSNDIPMSWDKYQAEVKKVSDAEATRVKVLTKVQQLQDTGKNIKPLEVELYKLNGGEPPELATLKIAQQVVTLSQTTHNQYVSLTPQAIEKVDYSQVIDIPIKPDDVGGASSPTTGAAQPAAQKPANGITPVGADGKPVAAAGQGAQGAAKELDPETTISAAKYVLVVKGNMRSLADFVYQLTSFKTLIFIRKLHIGTGAPASASNATAASGFQIASVGGAPSSTGGAPGAADSGPDDKKQITLEMTFLVPWSN